MPPHFHIRRCSVVTYVWLNWWMSLGVHFGISISRPRENAHLLAAQKNVRRLDCRSADFDAKSRQFAAGHQARFRISVIEETPTWTRIFKLKAASITFSWGIKKIFLSGFFFAIWAKHDSLSYFGQQLFDNNALGLKEILKALNPALGKIERDRFS